MNEDVIGIIYCYTFPNGKTYVGQTINECQRKRSHTSNALRKIKLPFYNAMNKYNFIYQYEILKVVHGTNKNYVINILNKYEIYYIKILNSLVNNNGYNVNYGGNNNWNKYNAIKISKIKKGNKKYKDIAYQAGMSNAIPIVSLDKFGHIIKEFSSIKEAERFYNFKPTKISKHINKLYCWDNKTNCYFRYKDSDYNKRSKPFIGKYSLDGKLIDVYVTYKDIGINISNVKKYIKNKIIFDNCYLQFIGGL